jgi:hypothetical protein
MRQAISVSLNEQQNNRRLAVLDKVKKSATEIFMLGISQLEKENNCENS